MLVEPPQLNVWDASGAECSWSFLEPCAMRTFVLQDLSEAFSEVLADMPALFSKPPEAIPSLLTGADGGALGGWGAGLPGEEDDGPSAEQLASSPGDAPQIDIEKVGEAQYSEMLEAHFGLMPDWIKKTYGKGRWCVCVCVCVCVFVWVCVLVCDQPACVRARVRMCTQSVSTCLENLVLFAEKDKRMPKAIRSATMPALFKSFDIMETGLGMHANDESDIDSF